MRDIREFHANFYSNETKIEQDALLLKYIAISKPKRERCTKANSSRKGVAVQYYVKLVASKTFQLQVCQNTFLRILHVSNDRVQIIARNHILTGKLPVEKRGGDTRAAFYEDRRKSVKSFIEKLKGNESHYCRSKNIQRQYLSSDLNISKLYRMYNESVQGNLKVKKTFFREIFLRDYNIGFGSPVTDACSKCIELSEIIKAEKDEQKKVMLMMEKRIHTLRSQAFFSYLKEESPGLLTLSFDCQKNLVNPKVPDQAAYYSRQLYTYNFTIVIGSSKSRLTLDNVFIYTWMEHKFAKGSNQICSAVFNLLSETDISQYSVIRLCADGCGGQNRNSTMIGMCSHFLNNVAPPNIKKIELIFPIPAYNDIFKIHGTLKILGRDCAVKDYKLETEKYFKSVGSWHFKCSETKRFILTKNVKSNVVLRSETFYNSEIATPRSILKKGKKLSNFDPVDIPKGVALKPDKLLDIRKLLVKHFGNHWFKRDDVVFYNQLL
nr:unnamed protein product [Callosobruchus chinensis]